MVKLGRKGETTNSEREGSRRILERETIRAGSKKKKASKKGEDYSTIR